MKWDSLNVTNVLLLIIAILMLVMVASQPQNDTPRYAASAPDLSQMGQVPSTGNVPNPHAKVPMGNPSTVTEDENFNFQNMIYAALVCPGDPTLTLADFGCKGDEATDQRAYIKAIYEQGLPPRALFDEIIDKYGIDALTDEAKEIRRNNRAGG